MNQQKQTLNYFNKNAADWNSKASSGQFSVIDNRHNAVLEVMKKYKERGRFLDVGCGTGQLAIEAAKNGWNSVGVDYAEPMIEICKENSALSEGNVEFQCGSIFDFQINASEYTVVSAQGFIEYISLEELDTFLSLVSRGLEVGGAVALGSRNRLFNLHSLNEFSSLEMRLNTVHMLMRESIVLQSAGTQVQALEQLGELNYEYDHPDTHPETGVKVDKRIQFSPSDLIKRLVRHGLVPTGIFPVHFHGLPLSLTGDEMLRTLHSELAELVSKQYINSHAFVPFSSSFVLEAKKI